MMTAVSQDPRSEKIVTSGEGRLSGGCPLCQCDGVQVVDQFPFRDLRLLYFETCEVDIVDCLDKPYHE